jgi:signal transduction histidine kinase
VISAGDAERRRIERNLHDGAQQRLVTLSLQLSLIGRRIRDDPSDAERLVTSASDELAQSLEELRELARGIHPAVLTERGLGAAIKGLAGRSPIPVDVAETPQDRLPAPIESAVYFIVAEALTNAARYATAHSVTVAVSHRNGVVDVVVTDDGVGGADLERGSGLRGLQDRVMALDGRLELASRSGEGTTLKVRMPCG